jgi:hypothetical protein
MPYIKINRGPRVNFTGNLGGIEFKNGRSVHNISTREAFRIGASVSVVDAETGKPVSVLSHTNSVRALKVTELVELNQKISESDSAKGSETGESPAIAQSEAPSTPARLVEEPESGATVQSEVPATEGAGQSADLWSFTREEIEALADKEGINGLREFSRARNVNGQSIAKIVEGLMARQAIAMGKAPASQE